MVLKIDFEILVPYVGVRNWDPLGTTCSFTLFLPAELEPVVLERLHAGPATLVPLLFVFL